jgi:hypothetical protein
MLQFRTTSSPFKQQTFYKQVELEFMCLDELRKAELLPLEPEPIRIETFVTKRFGVTPDYSAPLPNGILGLTRFGNSGPTDVFISKSLGEDTSDVGRRRTNATLAHEAGHGLLHGYLFVISGRKGGFSLGRCASVADPASGVDMTDRSFLCRDVDTNVTGHAWWEWQADAMIGPLLMPSPLVGKLLKTEFDVMMPSLKTGSISLQSNDVPAILKKMAEIFDVNPAAARIRLEKIGFSVKRS